jgi:hypothetical protein
MLSTIRKKKIFRVLMINFNDSGFHSPPKVPPQKLRQVKYTVSPYAGIIFCLIMEPIVQ